MFKDDYVQSMEAQEVINYGKQPEPMDKENEMSKKENNYFNGLFLFQFVNSIFKTATTFPSSDSATRS